MNARWLKYFPQFVRSRLDGRYRLQAALGNSGWLFADNILRLGVGLIVGVWIARYLGPQQFGLWSYVIAFMALFGAFATLGLDGIVVREVVKNPDQTDELLGSAFALKLIGSSVTFLIAILVISFMRSGETLTLWIAAISAASFIFQSVNVIGFYFQAIVQSRYTVYSATGAFVLMTLVKISLLVTSAPLISFVWAGLGEVAFSTLFLLIAYRSNRYKVWNWRYRGRVARELLRNGWPLMVSSLSIMIYMRIDQIMIGQMLGDREVGLYSAAVKINEAWGFIPTAIVSSLLPAIIEAKKKSEALYQERLQQLHDLMVWISLAVAVPLTILSDWVVLLLFGHAYEQAGVILAIHVWGGLFAALGVARGSWLLAENLQKYSFWYIGAGAVVNIPGNFLLIPLYGIKGAAIATLFSQAVVAVVAPFFFAKTRPSSLIAVRAMNIFRSASSVFGRK